MKWTTYRMVLKTVAPETVCGSSVELRHSYLQLHSSSLADIQPYRCTHLSCPSLSNRSPPLKSVGNLSPAHQLKSKEDVRVLLNLFMDNRSKRKFWSKPNCLIISKTQIIILIKIQVVSHLFTFLRFHCMYTLRSIQGNNSLAYVKQDEICMRFRREGSGQNKQHIFQSLKSCSASNSSREIFKTVPCSY